MSTASTVSLPLLEPRIQAAPARLSAGAVIAIGAAAWLIMLPVTVVVPDLKRIIQERFDAGHLLTHAFMSINMVGAVLFTPLIGRLCSGGFCRVRLATYAMLLDGALFLLMAAAPVVGVLLAVRFFEGAAHALALCALMTLAADAASPAHRGRVMGALGMCMMLGTATGTRLCGVLVRYWPDAPLLMIAGGLGLLAAVVLPPLLHVPRPVRSEPPRRLNGALALLWQSRGLQVAYAYAFVDRFCVGVIVSTFVLFLPDVHGVPSGEQVSRLLLLFLIPFALLVYPVGRLVDRVGAVPPLTIGSFAFGLVLASYGFVPLSWMTTVMLASGVCSALMFAPTMPLCAQLSPPDRRGDAYAGFNAAGSLGFICGPLVGGLIVQAFAGENLTFGYQAAFVVAGLTQMLCVLISLPVLLRIRRQPDAA